MKYFTLALLLAGAFVFSTPATVSEQKVASAAPVAAEFQVAGLILSE